VLLNGIFAQKEKIPRVYMSAYVRQGDMVALGIEPKVGCGNPWGYSSNIANEPSRALYNQNNYGRQQIPVSTGQDI
jgi:hypothetical protein